jgi:hypothetical protein
MEIANNIVDLKILEQKLFKNLALWHDEVQIKKMRVCDIVRSVSYTHLTLPTSP